jgi:two-component system CheB/CheR fusion protein
VNMARDGLDTELTVALYEAFDSDRIITRQGVWVKAHADERLINLIVMPIHDSTIGSRYRLVIFEPAASNLYPQDATPENPTGEEGVTIARIRDELQQTRRILQTATQALQAKTEELTSSMEEISSANEEIQTTNEELRTSKEELESMNEELNTLNTQLTSQNHELSNANNSLYNFLQSTAVGVIFLDQNLNIREYSQSATTFFSLRKGDEGRPLAEISSQLNYANLISDATRVLDSLVNLEQEVSTTDGRWYKVEIRPYRMMNNAIDGLVLTFNDISVQKQAQQTAENAALYIRKIIDTLENSVIELDSRLQVIAANTAFYQQFQVKPEDTLGKFLYDLGNGQWDIPDLRHLLNDIIPQQTFVRDYVVTHNFPQIGKRTMHLNAHQIKAVDRILVVITHLIDESAD